MMPLELAVDALAAYRLTRLAVKDDLTEPWRESLRSPFLAALTSCMWCAGVWAAFGVRLLPRWVRRALATAAVVGLIAERE